MPGATVRAITGKLFDGTQRPRPPLYAPPTCSPYSLTKPQTDTKVTQNCYTKGGGVCHLSTRQPALYPFNPMAQQNETFETETRPNSSILRTNPRTFLRLVSFSGSRPRTHEAMDYLTQKSNKTERSMSVHPKHKSLRRNNLQRQSCALSRFSGVYSPITTHDSLALSARRIMLRLFSAFC